MLLLIDDGNERRLVAFQTSPEPNWNCRDDMAKGKYVTQSLLTNSINWTS